MSTLTPLICTLTSTTQDMLYQRIAVHADTQPQLYTISRSHHIQLNTASPLIPLRSLIFTALRYNPLRMTTVARLWLQVNQPRTHVYFIVAIDTGETLRFVENYQLQRLVRSLRRPKGRRRYGHFDYSCLKGNELLQYGSHRQN